MTDITTRFDGEHLEQHRITCKRNYIAIIRNYKAERDKDETTKN